MRRHPILWLCVLALLLAACTLVAMTATRRPETPMRPGDPASTPRPTRTPTRPVVVQGPGNQPIVPTPTPCFANPWTECPVLAPRPTAAPGMERTSSSGYGLRPSPGTVWPTVTPEAGP